MAQDSAHLFVDSRYWIQAAKEIDNSWTLHRVGAPGERSWLDWIRHESTPNVLFGVDSRLISCGAFTLRSCSSRHISVHIVTPPR